MARCATLRGHRLALTTQPQDPVFEQHRKYVYPLVLLGNRSDQLLQPHPVSSYLREYSASKLSAAALKNPFQNLWPSNFTAALPAALGHTADSFPRRYSP